MIKLPINYLLSGYDSDAYADGYEDDDDYKTSSTTDENGIRFINDGLVKLEAHVTDLERYQLTMDRKGEELRRAVGDVESARDPTELLQRFNLARERATVFKVASMAMVNVSHLNVSISILFIIRHDPSLGDKYFHLFVWLTVNVNWFVVLFI
ncbi:unnamed protein product [Schistosoma curassoni]|uniref:t-SNARE coiled-coil homology domain-containing protein n=1 Tax=Schistosoma curassoni TaxID=6186 RepID=A0A183L639_9TREM|nr:unnamed protein product [Schistosoma curassoni]